VPGSAAARRGLARLFAAHLLTLWSISISNLLLGVAVLWHLRARRPRVPAAARPVVRLAVAYLLLLVVSVVASDAPRTSARALSEIFTFATLGLTLSLVRGERAVRWLVDTLVLLGALLAVSGLAQLAFGFGDLERRIRGPFSHYMTFAGVLLVVDLLLVGRMLARRQAAAARGPSSWLDRRAVAWGALALINWALVASLTRGAWVALVAALGCVVLLRRPRLVFAAPPLAVAFLILAPLPIVARVLSIFDLTDASNYDRLCMADAGLRMVAERPLLGIGPERVEQVYPLYRDTSAPRLVVPHLHNAYLQLAAERGIPALSVFLALLVAALGASWRGFRRDGPAADLHLGLLGAVLAFAVGALFENNWGDTEVQRLVLFALAAPFALAEEDAVS